jgi:hypothetical protein
MGKKEEDFEFGLDAKFMKLTVKLQDLRDGYLGEYPENVVKQIDEIGKQIMDEQLLEKCKDKTWARQLLMANDVPKRYWKHVK